MLKNQLALDSVSSLKLINEQNLSLDFTEQVKVIKGVIKLLVHDGKKDLPSGLYKVVLETQAGVYLASQSPVAISATEKPAFKG